METKKHKNETEEYLITNQEKAGKDHRFNKEKNVRAANPFISVDPATGERKDVASATEDIANRQALSQRTGIPVDQITALEPNGTEDRK